MITGKRHLFYTLDVVNVVKDKCIAKMPCNFAMGMIPYFYTISQKSYYRFL